MSDRWENSDRFVAVVKRGATETFAVLAEHFAEQGHVEIIWDRRVTDRRREVRPSVSERRLRERRTNPTTTWSTVTYLVFPRRAEHSTAPGSE
jgi:hypothetical protein